jgi:hypothetical protein
VVDRLRFTKPTQWCIGTYHYVLQYYDVSSVGKIKKKGCQNQKHEIQYVSSNRATRDIIHQIKASKSSEKVTTQIQSCLFGPIPKKDTTHDTTTLFLKQNISCKALLGRRGTTSMDIFSGLSKPTTSDFFWNMEQRTLLKKAINGSHLPYFTFRFLFV